MFKFAIFIFFTMTLGYVFGRIQQFNIDDSIPILFIVKKEEFCMEKKANAEFLRVVNGNWVRNEDMEEFFLKYGKGLLIPSDRKYFMYFEVETDELKGKLVFVNIAKKRMLKNSKYLKRKYFKAYYVINDD